jgi:DeoR family transcriptional regulator of aga operon
VGRHQRQGEILERVQASGRVRVSELAGELSASVATIRRDLHDLEEQQLLRCVHGGAVLWPGGGELPLARRAIRRLAEKRRIASAATRQLGEAVAVGFTGGTTTAEVARLVGQHRTKLTVFTTALNIAYEVAACPQIRCIIGGGEVHSASMEVVGRPAEDLAAKYRFDVVFVGVDGLTAAAGATGYDLLGSRVDHVLIERAARVVVVADSTKLGQVQPTQICPTDEIDMVITDTGADATAVAQLLARGVAVEQV